MILLFKNDGGGDQRSNLSVMFVGFVIEIELLLGRGGMELYDFECRYDSDCEEGSVSKTV